MQLKSLEILPLTLTECKSLEKGVGGQVRLRSSYSRSNFNKSHRLVLSETISEP